MTAKQLSIQSIIAAVVMFAGIAWAFLFGVLPWNGYLESIAGDPKKPATVTFFAAWLGPLAIGMIAFHVAARRVSRRNPLRKGRSGQRVASANQSSRSRSGL